MIKRYFLVVIFVSFVNIAFSQTIEELEYELSYYESGEEWGNKKDIAYKLLDIDTLNEYAIQYLIEAYGRNNQKDSANLLIEKIIKNNPNNPNVFLIIAEERNSHFAGLTFTQRINYLKQAKEIDNNNKVVIYMLGDIYYELFTKEYKKTNKKKTNLDYYSKNAIEYFYEICEKDTSFKETLKYPLIQLENYKGNKSKIKELERYKFQSSYFPISSFLSLPKDWRTNYLINVLDYSSSDDFSFAGVKSAVSHINWYSEYLKAFEEPILIDSLTTEIYRFTYLRTFDNPIVIRLESNNDSVIIYWKVLDGKGGYSIGKIIENKSKVLIADEWENIEKQINSIKYWSLGVDKEIIGEDGSQWILEGKKLGKYHVVDRWCGGKISSVCKELIKLTDLKIEDIY